MWSCILVYRMEQNDIKLKEVIATQENTSKVRGRKMVVEATAYTHTGSNTATGVYPRAGHTIAVDPNVIPLGSIVKIGGKEYKAEDTGGVIDGRIIDIFMDSEAECYSWGRREIEIEVIK